MASYTQTTQNISLFTLNPQSDKFIKLASTNWKYQLFLLTKLPMGFLARLKVDSINENEVIVSVPYNKLNSNPFQSTYFGVLAMAAELSTGIPSRAAIYEATPKTSMLVTGLNAQFTKKAKGRTRFICKDTQKIYQAVQKTNQTGEWETADVETIGYNDNNEIIAKFTYQWSYRTRLQ